MTTPHSAWAEGYEAGRRDQGLHVTVVTANPYPDWSLPTCPVHRPKQHRDRLPAWCPNCGKGADGRQVKEHAHEDKGGGHCLCGAERCSLPQCDAYCTHPDGWVPYGELKAMRTPDLLKIMAGVDQDIKAMAQELVSQMPLDLQGLCDHPLDLRAVQDNHLICGQCGVLLDGSRFDPSTCPHPLHAIRGDGRCSQCGKAL